MPDVYKKSAPYPGGPKKVPVGRFFERKYHDLEVDRLWKKVWQMACRLEDIPETGDYIIYKVAHLEYIVVRTGENEVKAHVNAAYLAAASRVNATAQVPPCFAAPTTAGAGTSKAGSRT